MTPSPGLFNNRIAVAIVENDTFVRDGMTRLLGRFDDFNIVAAVTSPDAPKLAEAKPAVILIASHLIDASHPLLRPVGIDGWRPRVVVTGVSPDQEDLLALVRAGVMGFVVRDALFFELLSTIRTVASGTPVVPARLYATVARNLAREHEDRKRERLVRLGKMRASAVARDRYEGEFPIRQ
ncbi:MAG TPA: hypothetical protein VE967_14485 [Gemmatimonadaceae bacterium]|nr:hypothetical protein [Gemmatimonadaceae bacterium]